MPEDLPCHKSRYDDKGNVYEVIEDQYRGQQFLWPVQKCHQTLFKRVFAGAALI